jgi:transcriptional regulator with XRE-family HTH domain
MSPKQPETTPTIPTWTTGDRIAKARRHAGLTAQEIADEVGVTRTSVSNWETGHAPCRSIFLKEIARLTGVDYGWLAGNPPATQGKRKNMWIPDWACHAA